MSLFLISDANILFDVEAGGLTTALFQLSFTLKIPDILFEQELGERYQHLLEQGLDKTALSSDSVKYVLTLTNRYSKISRNDCFALALAKQEACDLLTGDMFLRKAAENEQLKVKGTIWLIEQMILQNQLSVTEAENAYQKMGAADRRLPWDKVKISLKKFK